MADQTVDNATILELSDRLKRLDGAGASVPLYQLPPFEGDIRVSPAQNVELISAQPTTGATKVAIRWIKPSDPNIDRFEIWISRAAYDSEVPYLVASVTDSPASFTVTSDKNTVAVAYIRTILKNGLSTDLNASPTVTFNVSMQVDASAITNLSSISIGSFSGNLDVSRVDRLNIIAINSFQGNLDVSRINNLNTIAISSFAGYLDVSRIQNLYSIALTNFYGNLDVSRINNIYSLNIGSFYGNLDVSRVTNIGSLNIQNFTGTLSVYQLGDNTITSAKIYSLSASKIDVSGYLQVGYGGIRMVGYGGIVFDSQYYTCSLYPSTQSSTILCSGNFIASGMVSASASGFNAGGSNGLTTGAMAFALPGGGTGYMRFQGGILVATTGL